MSLRTSRSTPSLVSSAAVGDTELRAPLKTLHLHLISNSSPFKKVLSETDLKHKGGRSSFSDSPVNQNLSVKYRVADKKCGRYRSGEKEEDDANPMHVGGGGGFGFIGGNDANSNFNNNNDMDAYYQKMLEANPGNSLLLRNYARFLHEVKHDMEKAEEYYERAVLASPDDGDVLANYAKFVWELRNDRQRAQMYFQRAVQAAPHDCYVVASHAHFLWNTEDEEKEERHIREADERVAAASC